MESMFEEDISILTQEALGPSEVWLDGPGDPSLGGDMCSASHFYFKELYLASAPLIRDGQLSSPKSSVRLTLRRGPLGLIQLQKNKEQEEQLGEMIQAYEKLCVEKSDLETELGEMVRALVETHLRQICGLEQQLRQQQVARRHRLRPRRARAVLAVHQLADGDGGLRHPQLPPLPAGFPCRVPG
uniref:TBK1 binding protein 1 n=1 Tax=Nomascus leucogenys TaxID=61853 RepID=A0A2I3GGZ0_NOMLE